MVYGNHLEQKTTLTEALSVTITPGSVITAVGAGGKTSLLFTLGRELAAAGYRTVITTTTHMGRPCSGKADHPAYQGVSFVCMHEKEARERIPTLLASEKLVFAAAPDPENACKVTAPSAEDFTYLREQADILLVEGDGSRRLPLKWPAPWEPVIPEATACTVCVAGLSALGRPCHEVIYRAEDIPNEFSSGDQGDRGADCLYSLSPGGRREERKGRLPCFPESGGFPEPQRAALRILKTSDGVGITGAWGKLQQTGG